MAMPKQGASSTSCRNMATWSSLSVVVGGLAASGASVAFVSHTASAYPSIGEHRQYEQSGSKAFLSQATAAPTIGSQVSPAGILAACGVAATVATALRSSGARSSGRSAMRAKTKVVDEDASGNLKFSGNGPPSGVRGFAPGSKAAVEAAANNFGKQTGSTADKKVDLSAPGSKAASEATVVKKAQQTKQTAAGNTAKVASMWPKISAGEKGETGKEYAGQIGDTLPFRYWDPLGLATSGDDRDFRRRRMAEIKNGRVAMIASMGYIAPEFFRWPGYCSPSISLKFTDIPNGVGALYKVPTEGWAQIGVFIGFLELFPLRQENNRVAGDFASCGRLGVPWFFIAGRNGSVCDPDRSKRSLDSELNNGRLAMVAITGMIFQNGFTGTTGAEMWIPPA